MINLKSITLSTEGELKKVSATYDEISEDGKILGTNNRLTRIITDDNAIKNFDDLMSFTKSLIEEG